MIRLSGFGESLARLDNYCEIDPQKKDAWGIPALRIQMTHGPNEAAMMEDAAATAAETAGGDRGSQHQGECPDGHCPAWRFTKWGRPGWGTIRPNRS